MKNTMMKMVAKAALKTAHADKVKHSTLFSYQPKMPDQLKKTDK